MLFDVAPQPGNIPAYAGRTQERSLNAPYRQKHPRIRGENHRDLRRGRFFLETSPHTRGEPSAAVSVLDRPGNIPAYAGRTIYGEDVNLDAEKHPRIRGENAAAAQRSRTALETSPHTRGEPVLSGEADELSRNIPAYAGRTSSWVIPSLAIWKHPRIRGENWLPKESCTIAPETSPHTRGEHRRSVFMRARQGNIPAYAGRTDAKAEKTAQLEKHPRIRGENVEALFGSASILETSPHTRGERGLGFGAPLLHGNIPAYAGRTSEKIMMSPPA